MSSSKPSILRGSPGWGCPFGQRCISERPPQSPWAMQWEMWQASLPPDFRPCLALRWLQHEGLLEWMHKGQPLIEHAMHLQRRMTFCSSLSGLNATAEKRPHLSLGVPAAAITILGLGAEEVRMSPKLEQLYNRAVARACLPKSSKSLSSIMNVICLF